MKTKMMLIALVAMCVGFGVAVVLLQQPDKPLTAEQIAAQIEDKAEADRIDRELAMKPGDPPPPAQHHRDYKFMVNPDLERDAVELEPEPIADQADFYHTDLGRPANVPTTCVLVRVFQGSDELVGYAWMEANEVKRLHGQAHNETL